MQRQTFRFKVARHGAFWNLTITERDICAIIDSYCMDKKGLKEAPQFVKDIIKRG
jgi:hypothetical protein